MNAPDQYASVRYLVDDVDAAVDFYTTHLGFRLLTHPAPPFADVVRVRYILPDRDDFEPCWPVLRRCFGDVRPAATMLVCGLADPRMKIEIEVYAQRPAR